MWWPLEREALGIFVTSAEPAAAMNNLRRRSHLRQRRRYGVVVYWQLPE
ncbi:MAG TPA: hypothetical protein VJS67_13680 [Pseudonocardiaceae bacterium]|nr:hypothetical protein [Pseudonocardiaceae bacterium]